VIARGTNTQRLTRRPSPTEPLERLLRGNEISAANLAEGREAPISAGRCSANGGYLGSSMSARGAVIARAGIHRYLRGHRQQDTRAMTTLLRTFLAALAAAVIAAWPVDPALAQAKATLQDAKAARVLTDAIMVKVAAGDLEGGLRMMQPYIVIPAAELESTIGQAKLQVPAMAQRFGKSIGSEFLKEDKAGERVLRIQHLQLFEQHATRWTFYFYRTPKGWVLNTFLSNDDIKMFF
jgi:hypothetical protein